MANRSTAYALIGGFALFLILTACLACFYAESAGAQAASDEGARQEEVSPVDCRELAAMLQEQKSLVSRETGQLKREIAALREELSRPGIKEIFAGIGYIFGLAGVGLYAHGRGTRKK